MATPIRVLGTRAAQSHSFKPPRSRDAAPHYDFPLVPVEESDSFPPAWASDITRFSTLSGALTLTPSDLRALKSVPREHPTATTSANVRVTRTRSMIEHGQNITFSFQTGPKHVANKGLPVYALAMTSREELCKHMLSAREQVMASFGLKRVRFRIQWPFPRDDGLDLLTHEEWVKVDGSTTRMQLAMLAADVFRQFFDKHRMPLSAIADYAWLLKPDAFYRVWLVGLERVESNVFAVDLKYVKDHPSRP
ncbi:hypothetical protein BC628DRAFT_478393 [Trametes gibbosa]|nr:hypothetical protein BC628DRAFT_478393 [Trametes gibbosa]